MDVGSAAERTATLRAPPLGYLYLLLSLMIFFWSLNFVIVKIALREIPPVLLSSIRIAMASATLIGIFAARRGRHRSLNWTKRDVAALVALGISGVALNQGFFALGLSRTSVAHAAILIGLTPVQVLLLAAATGQEKLTLRKITGLGVALFGVAVLQISRESAGAASIAGDACILMSGFSFAVYTVFGKRLTTRHDSLTMNMFAYTGSAVALSPAIFFQPIDYRSVSAAAWLSVAYMALFASVAAYLIYNYALTHIEASRVSAASYVQPLLATLIAIPLLGEHLTTSIISGGALVLAGVYVTERP